MASKIHSIPDLYGNLMERFAECRNPVADGGVLMSGIINFSVQPPTVILFDPVTDTAFSINGEYLEVREPGEVMFSSFPDDYSEQLCLDALGKMFGS